VFNSWVVDEGSSVAFRLSDSRQRACHKLSQNVIGASSNCDAFSSDVASNVVKYYGSNRNFNIRWRDGDMATLVVRVYSSLQIINYYYYIIYLTLL
jgi:hypothetical protein